MPEDVAMDMTASAGVGAGGVGADASTYVQSWQAAQFGPGAPNAPVRPADEQPRVFDFPPGINLFMTPRGGYGLLPFQQLRSFASLCEEVRIVVESIKREIRALEWDFVPSKKGDKTNYDKDKDALRQFWEKPDGQRDFDSWLNSVLDDMLVIDAPSLWLHMDEGGNSLLSVEQIDGALVRPLLDVRGKTPSAPLPAYVQMIKGQVWQWFSAERLIYKPFNANITSPYGASPIEFMIIRINQALRKKFSDAQYWDQTNVPEAILGLPAEWTTEQIKVFQEYFDALLVGDTAKLRRLKFLPSNGTNLPVYEFRRPAETTTFDEWMLKLACWCFGFTPAELGIVSGSGLGGKGFMEGAENTQYRLGFGPMVQYVESLITSIVRMQTKAPLQFKFMNIGPQEDQAAIAQLNEIELRNGIIDVNAWREQRGQPPIPNAKPFMLLNGVPTFLDDLFAPKPEPQVLVPAAPPEPGDQPTDQPEDENADGQQPAAASQRDEADKADKGGDAPPEFVKLALEHWREKSLRRMKDGKRADCEPPAVSRGTIPVFLQKSIRDQLAASRSLDDVGAVFRGALVSARPKALGRSLVPKLGKASDAGHPTSGRNTLEAAMKAWLASAFASLTDELPDFDEDADAADGAPDVDKLIAPEASFWKVFVAALLPGLVKWLTSMAQLGVDEVHDPEEGSPIGALPPDVVAGVSWDLANDVARDWAQKHAGDLVTGITDVTRDRIRTALAGSIQKGEAMPDLVQRINDIIGDKQRAEVIAQTESTNAYSQGNEIAWDAADVWGSQWFTAQDEIVCETCGPLAGQIRPMGEAFIHPDTKEEINAPAAHPRCRCYRQPVMDQPDDWDEETGMSESMSQAG